MVAYYTPAQLPDSFIYILQSWDTASKSGELNDFSVCTTWGVANGKYYLLDVFRRRLDYPDLKRAVWEQARKYRHPKVLIEDKGSGTQLIQELRREGLIYVKAYEPPSGADKIMRLFAQSHHFESGIIWAENFSNAPPPKLRKELMVPLLAYRCVLGPGNGQRGMHISDS
jgi:predicted phage terminase large subunit-like protein